MPQNVSGVVVGVDGLHSSLGAARWAAAVAKRFGMPLHLVHSMTTTGHFVSDAAVVAIRAAADQHAVAEKILAIAEQTVNESCADVPIATRIVSEPADKALVEMSRQADLVVMGCDDVNPFAALLLGSTSLAVATHALCPVVVWREFKTPTRGSVVVGVDGTPAGSAALAAAFEYAARFNTSVTAVHSWSAALPADEAALSYLVDWEALETAERKVLTDAVAEWTKRYPQVDVQLFVEQAKPGRALIQHLADAQLVVVGNHRPSALAAALLGSTTLNLLHHSSVPVMVCHAAEEAAH